ncbi:hypothetical protein A6302_04492 [Methylobrevis pamukkalensis]|uniref:Uncharacterized protein n=1 Tax=Methylobrevis pamukkalensis TaxID=1439726 RepID=A0A1E3GP55_9HYPH|nr:hypothetical protein A6302_04492 [Methylobrevis pamukkalensis]
MPRSRSRSSSVDPVSANATVRPGSTAVRIRPDAVSNHGMTTGGRGTGTPLIGRRSQCQVTTASGPSWSDTPLPGAGRSMRWRCCSLVVSGRTVKRTVVSGFGLPATTISLSARTFGIGGSWSAVTPSARTVTVRRTVVPTGRLSGSVLQASVISRLRAASHQTPSPTGAGATSTVTGGDDRVTGRRRPLASTVVR